MVGLKRSAGLCAILLGGVTGWASAEKALPCADYVSTGQHDDPGVGHLIGTETVQYEISVEPGGVGASVTVTFEVGIYDFGNERQKIDCRDYTLWDGAA